MDSKTTARNKHLETLLVICLGMIVLHFLWGSPVFLWVGLGIGAAGLFVPVLGRYVHVLWTGIGHVMGWINAHILLAVLFYLVLFPIASLRRLLAKDPMARKKHGGPSYFVTREHRYTPKDLENPW